MLSGANHFKGHPPVRDAPLYHSPILGNQKPIKERMVGNWINNQILNHVTDLCYHVLIGKKHTVKCSIQFRDKEKKGANSQPRRKMALRKEKCVPKQEEGTNKTMKRKG